MGLFEFETLLVVAFKPVRPASRSDLLGFDSLFGSLLLKSVLTGRIWGADEICAGTVVSSRIRYYQYIPFRFRPNTYHYWAPVVQDMFATNSSTALEVNVREFSHSLIDKKPTTIAHRWLVRLMIAIYLSSDFQG